MRTFGQHWLAEYHDCNRDVLDDVERIESILRQAALAARATIVAATFHRFSPKGVSGVVLLEESHLSIHTWPDHGYAAVDFYTCGSCLPEHAHEFIRDALGAKHAEVLTVHRGSQSEPDHSGEPPSGKGLVMRVHRHYEESCGEPREKRKDQPVR